ncbi:MAG: condensation domain-containing protein, partial [Bacteroidota bacterium]
MNMTCHPQQTLFPLSSVQREVWFDQILYPDTPVYNTGGYLRIDGDIDVDIFRKALIQLVNETDILRFKPVVKDDVPFQTFPEMGNTDMGYFDLSDEPDPEQTALKYMMQDHLRPFRIFEEPLFRHNLFKISEGHYFWAHSWNHLIVDNWAVSLVTQRISVIYNALLQCEPIPAPRGAHYSEFIKNDEDYMGSENFEVQCSYWKQKFTTLPEPMFYPKTANPGIEGSVHNWSIPRSLYEQLEALGKAHSVSITHVLLGLLYAYFTRVQDKDECVIGLPILNRNSHIFKQTIGMFISLIPERFSFPRDLSFISLIQSIAKTLKESYRFQRLPISMINRLAGTFKTGRKQLFDISFSFAKMDYSTRFGNSGPTEIIEIDNGLEINPVTITVGEYSKETDISVKMAYNTAYFSFQDMRDIENRLMSLMEDVLRNPEKPVSHLDFIPSDEKQKIIAQWNNTNSPLNDNCVHSIFEQQAVRTPDAVAVVFEDKQITYCQLNASANQLAHRLISLGVKPGTIVAIALERSAEMIIAILAVLKAGGAYLPIDTDYPSERLDF